MRVSVLGSGSAGNATLVEAQGTRLLLDAGFSARELTSRLAHLGVAPESISAVVVTHEHGDHTRGMGVFARRHGATLYLTEATHRACAGLLKGNEGVAFYRPTHPFRIGSIRVEPYLAPHDAADPVAIALVDETTGLRLGVATDLGRANAQVRHALSGSDFLVLEANHDESMLHGATYPPKVRSRIAGSHGHLSNHAAARLALDLLHPGLVGVLLAHLSAECNRPELARSVVGKALSGAGFRGFLGVAGQDEPTELMDLTLMRRQTAVQLSLL